MLSNVVHVFLELRIVLEVAALVEIGNIDEVPVGLPAATLILDLVSERSALHEWVLVLAICNSFARHCREDLLSAS